MFGDHELITGPGEQRKSSKGRSAGEIQSARDGNYDLQSFVDPPLDHTAGIAQLVER